MIKLQSKLQFVNAVQSNFRMFFTDVILLHIQSKHDVFSDVTEQNCLLFSQMSFWFGTANPQKKKVCHFIATLWDMNDVSFTLSYANF